MTLIPDIRSIVLQSGARLRSRSPGGLWREVFSVSLVLAGSILVAGCPSRDGQGRAPPASTSTLRDAASAAAPATNAVCRPTVVGTFPGSVDALAISGSQLILASRSRGEIASLDLSPSHANAPARVIASKEREPFAVVIRGASVAWASDEGVVAAGLDGKGRQVLLPSPGVAAIAPGSSGLFVAVRHPAAIWRLNWPGSGASTVVVPDAHADELVVAGDHLAWVHTSGAVMTHDLTRGVTRTIADNQRKPHDLSVFRGTIAWHEGEAELLPGRAPGAFTADLQTGVVTPAVGAQDSSNRYLPRGARIYGAAVCKAAHETTFQRLDSGEGEPPITDDAERWYWARDEHDGSYQILAADKSACCT